MKLNYIIIGFALALITSGCTESANKTKSSSGAIDKQTTQAQEVADQAALDLKTYSFEKKADFTTHMNKQLVKLETEIEELSSKVENSSDKVKAEAKPKLATLKEQASSLRKQIGSVKDATPTTWTGIKADSGKAYDALKLGVLQSREWLADKIAP